MRSVCRKRFINPLITACCLLALALAGAAATAQVTSVTVDYSKPFEKVAGYTYVEATMHGTVERDDGTVGEYSVPMILIYPNDGGNSVGVVDWPTSTYYGATGHEDLDESMTMQNSRDVTDGYLFEQSYTYASVQWNKEVTELFGPSGDPSDPDYNHLVYGKIEKGTDVWHILRDAARFLRDPSALDSADGPLPVDTVLSFGFSQTAALQNQFLSLGENTLDGELVYDGHLLSVAGYLCETRTDEAPFYSLAFRCDDPSAHHQGRPVDDGSKMIAIQTQSDLEGPLFFAVLSRFEDEPNWRQYELGGVSHLPPSVWPDLSEVQNPADFRPVFRAGFHNLKLWTTEGTAPPPPKYLDGEVIPDGEELAGALNTDLDEDGNALGGLRLPHMEQVIDGEVAGAPLGVYAGLNPDIDPDDPISGFVLFAGTFTPFSDEELAERYPDHETYVNRVTRAADYLWEKGYILEEDRDAYVREAEQSSIGR